MLKTNKFIAFEVPVDSYETRADFILGDTRDSKQRRAVVKFLREYKNKYDIRFVDVSGYRGLTLKPKLADDVIKRMPYDPLI